MSAIALLLAAAAHAAPAFTVVERRSVPGAGDMPLVLVVESGSPWTDASALDRELGKVSGILARCGRPLGETTVLTVRWSEEALAKLRDEDPYKAPAQLAAFDAPELPAGRPVGFLFSAGATPSTAKAFNRTSSRALAARHPEAARLEGSFFITADQGFRRAPDIAPSYSTMAHELVHILGDLGHVSGPYNLMSNAEVAGAKTGDLDDAQCAAVRSYGR